MSELKGLVRKQFFADIQHKPRGGGAIRNKKFYFLEKTPLKEHILKI